jgi:hypothetical protein
LGNIPRHAQSPGDYFQNLKDGSWSGMTRKSLNVLLFNTLHRIENMAQTMQKVMHIKLL